MAQNIAIRTSDLIDRFGVATHLAYTDGGYRELSATTNALSYLGIDHIRDGVTNPAHDSYGQAHFAQAAASGIHFTFVADGGVDPVTEVARIHAIEQATPGAVTAIEGPNEVNNWPVTYQRLIGTAGAQAYMRDLFNAVQADPLLRDITVTGFTDWPNHSSTSDASTIHPYAKEGDQPLAQIMRDMADQNAVDPGKVFFITETGYHTQINPSSGWEGVSEATQAKLVLNTYMDGVMLGAKQVYVYQLLDAYVGNSQEEHFGLFRLDNSPKPVATAIHNLTSILADTAGNAGTFATHTLDFTVSNAPASEHTLLAEKSNGTYQLVTWAEPDIWDQATNQAITVEPTTETISFGQTFQTIEIFDPLLGTSAIKTFHNANTVNVDVSDHPLIVQLSGGMNPQQPISLSAGSGPDTLVLRISEDAWKGDAQYTIKVDGRPIGEVFTAQALHSANQSDTLTLHGSWGNGAHTVTVNFLNDSYGDTADTDRNLHVDGIIYNGKVLAAGTADLMSNGPVDFAFTDTGTGAIPALFGIPGTWGQAAQVWSGQFDFGDTRYQTYDANPAWGGVSAVQLAPKAWGAAWDTHIAVDNFVTANLDLRAAGARALDVLVVSAQNGVVQLGNGDDTVTWVAHRHAEIAGNNFTIKTGAGDDVVHLTAAGLTALADYDKTGNGRLYNAGYDGTGSNAHVTLGAGQDTVTTEGGVRLVLNASSGFATATGGKAGDLFYAGSGGGEFTGGGGRDTFILDRGDGHVTIEDFTSGTDRLKFIGLTKADIRTAAATEGGVAGLRVTYDAEGDSIFLAHVSKINASDMLFA